MQLQCVFSFPPQPPPPPPPPHTPYSTSLPHTKVPNCACACLRMGRGECSREPRNLEPRKLILEAESCLSRIFAPPKITRYTVACSLEGGNNLNEPHPLGRVSRRVNLFVGVATRMPFGACQSIERVQAQCTVE